MEKACASRVGLGFIKVLSYSLTVGDIINQGQKKDIVCSTGVSCSAMALLISADGQSSYG
jgi:hypothetical protein